MWYNFSRILWRIATIPSKSKRREINAILIRWRSAMLCMQARECHFKMTNHTRKANKRTAHGLAGSLLFRRQTNVMWQMCRAFSSMKNSHTHFMPIITIIYIHLLDFYNHSLGDWCSTDTHHNRTFRFISLFIFSSVLREHFTALNRKKRSSRMERKCRTPHTL